MVHVGWFPGILGCFQGAERFHGGVHRTSGWSRREVVGAWFRGYDDRVVWLGSSAACARMQWSSGPSSTRHLRTVLDHVNTAQAPLHVTVAPPAPAVDSTNMSSDSIFLCLPSPFVQSSSWLTTVLSIWSEFFTQSAWGVKAVATLRTKQCSSDSWHKSTGAHGSWLCCPRRPCDGWCPE